MDEIMTIKANGLEFGYLSAGSPTGPLALLLHGFPDTPHTWRHLMPALAEAGYRVVAPYMRGYAPTSVPSDGAYQTGALASDANALHEALGGGPDSVIIGHDWGAATTYGATNAEPGRWRKAVTLALPPVSALLSGFLTYDQLKRSFYIFVFQTPLAELALNEQFLASLWRDWSPGHTEDLTPVFDAILRSPENTGAALGYYRAMLDTSRHQSAYAERQAATETPGTVPTLYLHGADDGCLAADAIGLDALPDHLPPGSRADLVPRSGHFLQVERPAEVNAAILEWLAP
ncbi:alpha/beta hydrolase [Actinocorallia longicatena]|uniref:Alpha/beta hydrolase n=1 Tax=Actinocorallia longicatena TaxID=111803 RepID=A0ABP6QI14_9ACTN